MDERPRRLADLPTDDRALEQLYRAGRAPGRLRGAYRGRLLPIGVPAGVARLVPWRGKVFGEGEGANRIGGRRFPFDVRPGSSVLDGAPCLVLAYRQSNPPGVRRIVDELREVGPGLYLGPGLLRLRGRLRRWTWFALVAEQGPS